MRKHPAKGTLLQKPLLRKLLVSFILFFIAPTLIVGGYMFSVASRSLTTELNETASRILEYIRDYFDSFYIDRQRELLDISFSTDLARALAPSTSPSRRILHISRLQQLLASHVITRPELHSAYIYLRAQGRVISNIGLHDVSDFPHTSYLTEVWARRNSPLPESFSLGDEGQAVSLLPMWQQVPFGEAESEGLVILNIKKQYLGEELGRFRFVQDMILHVVDAEGDVFLRSSSVQITDPHEYISPVTESRAGRWTYVSHIPDSFIRDKLAPLSYALVILCGVLVIVGLILSYRISAVFYHPVERLLRSVQALAEVRNTPPGGESEYELIGRALNNFSRSNEQMRHILTEKRDAIKNNLFRRLFEGLPVSEEELRDTLEYLELDLHDQSVRFCVSAFDIDNYADLDVDQKLFATVVALAPLVEHAIDQTAAEGLCLPLHPHRLYVMYYGTLDPAEMKEAARTASSRVLRMLRDHAGVTFTCGMGCVVGSLEAIRESFVLSDKAVNYRMVRGGGQVIDSSSVLTTDRTFYVYPLSDMQKIVNQLTAARKADMLAVLGDMFDVIEHRPDISVAAIRYSIVQLLSLASEALFQLGISFEQVLEDDSSIFEQIEQRPDLQHLEAWVTEALSRLCDEVSHRTSSHDALIDRALSFMHTHYGEPISLTDVAEEVGVSPQYLSTRFKTVIGVNYVDYLNAYRLERAREMLQTTDATVKTIARQAGFGDYKYFVRRFRDRFGVTPVEIRNSIIHSS